MNKNNLNKLKLFFSGIEGRFKENKDFFENISFSFKSGLKLFKGTYEFKDGKYIYSFKGIRKDSDIGSCLKDVLKEAELYDELVFVYKERGSIVEISADSRDVKMKNTSLEDSIEENKSKEIKSEHKSSTSTLLNRNYFVNHVSAEKLLKELDILSKDGKVKNDRIRKYNQIDHYIEVLDQDLDRFKGKTIHIVDCGCGKSYLSFVLNYYITEVKKIKCYFTGIDISPKVIEKSRKMAENLNYRNMEFLCADIRDLKVKRKPDIVLSLHACDIATDLALSFAIKNEAELIVAVPCCHAEMSRKFSYDPFDSILKHGILKRRLADVLTDGVRTLLLESEGYRVSIFEYISPLETPKNLMIKAYRTNKKNEKSLEEFNSLMLQLNYAPALYRYLNNLDIDDLDAYEIEDDYDDEF